MTNPILQHASPVFGGQSLMLALPAYRRLRVAVALAEAQALADSRRPEPYACARSFSVGAWCRTRSKLQHRRMATDRTQAFCRHRRLQFLLLTDEVLALDIILRYQIFLDKLVGIFAFGSRCKIEILG